MGNIFSEREGIECYASLTRYRNLDVVLESNI